MSLSRPTIGGTRNQPLWVALAFIVLVGLIFVVTMQRMNSTDDFLKVWAAVGPIVGVVTGLIPTYFLPQFRPRCLFAGRGKRRRRRSHEGTHARPRHRRGDQ